MKNFINLRNFGSLCKFIFKNNILKPMNKLLTLGIMAMMASSVYSQEAVKVTTGNLWRESGGGMMSLGMSANGRYIVGACADWEAFIYDCQTNTLTTTAGIEESLPDTGAKQIWAVTDDGVAYGYDGGGGFQLSIDGEYKLFEPLGNFYTVEPMCVTADGSIIAGFVNTSFTDSQPCYWENGELHYLSFSSSEEAGFKINGGCRALGISTDGSIIYGTVMSRSQTNPLVYWLRQPDGSYRYVEAFKDMYEDSRDVDGNLKEYYTTRLYKLFNPACMSPDGKNIVLYIQRVLDGSDGTPYVGPEEAALLNVETNEVTPIPYSRDNFLYSESEFSIVGLSNNGYMVGYAGYVISSNPFVLSPGEYDDAKLLTQAFPGDELLEHYEDVKIDYNGLYLVTGLSADASRICGYIEDDIEEEEYAGFYGMQTYYINTGYAPVGGGDSGVTEVVVPTAGEAAYYDLQGRKVTRPERGIFIRIEDGKASKVVK